MMMNAPGGLECYEEDDGNYQNNCTTREQVASCYHGYMSPVNVH